MELGEKIRKLRKEKGMTQKELSAKLGTTPQNLAQYENGKRNPKIETLQKIADALNVNPLCLRGDITDEYLQAIQNNDIDLRTAYLTVFKDCYGYDVDISRDEHGMFYIFKDNESNRITKISDLTLDNITDLFHDLIQTYVSIANSNDNSQIMHYLMYCIQDMTPDEIKTVAKFAAFIKNNQQK